MAVKTKVQILAEIASLFADNTIGDISAQDVRTVCNDIVDSYFDAPYKEYTILTTQTSTNAPVLTVLQNSLSGTPVAAYTSTGKYTLTLAGEFPVNKVYILFGGENTGTPGYSIQVFRTSDDVISIETSLYAAGVWNYANAVLTATSISIRVYA